VDGGAAAVVGVGRAPGWGGGGVYGVVAVAVAGTDAGTVLDGVTEDASASAEDVCGVMAVG
jgi:hypothetical protein